MSGRARLAGVLSVALLGLSPVARAGAPWPAESDWIPVRGPGGGVLTDPANDYGGGQNVFDIVGDAVNTVGYFYTDGTTYFVRVRLAESPDAGNNKWKSFAFFALQETDRVATDGSYDFSFYLDGPAKTV